VPDPAAYLELESVLSPQCRLLHNEPLAHHTTLRVGGSADCYAEPASEETLARIVQFCGQHQISLILIGRGSNLLVRDGGIRGVVVSLCHPAFSRLEVHPPFLAGGAGLRLRSLVVAARHKGLAGIEFLEGIPGSLGGALRMNAGAMGSALFDVTKRVRCMDRSGRIEEREASAIPVSYRNCPFFQEHIALSAVLEGRPDSPEAIGRRMSAFGEKRWASQPAAPSAGCIFKNPSTIPAGQLVDELGLKGTRIGGAVVSDVHGNFIINTGTATARDILQLMELVRARARAERGIDLENEVQILGEDSL
jgi:UDP-N-acetylenolpyruvoylglucosamine reductase